MKFKLLAVVIPALFVTSAMAKTEGETSTINFNGTISEATCSLTAGSSNQPVELGTVAANTFGGENGVSNAKEFSIVLSDCDTDVAKNASVAFSGDTSNDTALKVTGGAANVGIQILQNGAPLTLDGVTQSADQTLVTGENTLKFAARYIALGDEVTAGGANATAHFTLYYE